MVALTNPFKGVHNFPGLDDWTSPPKSLPPAMGDRTALPINSVLLRGSCDFKLQRDSYAQKTFLQKLSAHHRREKR